MFYILNVQTKKCRKADCEGLESYSYHIYHMVSLCQEQNPIKEFAVPFLEMFALCKLWRAQFLYDFYSVFCVHQILSFGPL